MKLNLVRKMKMYTGILQKRRSDNAKEENYVYIEKFHHLLEQAHGS